MTAEAEYGPYEEHSSCTSASEQLHEGEPVDTLFFVVIALLLGVFSRAVLKHVPLIPYTAWMLVRAPRII